MEFALVLPIFLLLLFAIIDFGWYFTREFVLINAVSQGARSAVGTVRQPDETVSAYVQRVTEKVRETAGDLYWIGTLSESRITVEVELSGGLPDTITVVGKDNYRSLTGFLPSSLLPEDTRARTVMAFL